MAQKKNNKAQKKVVATSAGRVVNDTPDSSNSKNKTVLNTVLYIVAIICWVGAAVILSQIVVGYLMLLILGKEVFSQPIPTAIYSALSYVLAMVLIIFVHKKASRKTLGLHGLPTWTDLGLAPVGYLVYLIIAFLLTSLFALFPWFNTSEVQDVGFSIYIFGFDRVVAFITLVVIAPIVEEIIFRGWLYGKMRARLSGVMTNRWSIVVSILLVSLLFGAVHMQWNVGVNVFALSLVLCALREITGTIYSGIFLHMLKNGIAFFLLFILGMS